MENRRAEKWFLVGEIAVLLLLAILPYVSQAAIPQTINYQGYLTNASGVPINGTMQMTFKIYDVGAGGAALWTEVHSVAVDKGVYNVVLGEGTPPIPINLTFDVQYYLGIKVGTDPEMTPRIPLTSVGYSFRAKTVETIGSHTHSGGDINTGIIPDARIDGEITRDNEIMFIVRANDGAGSGVDADFLDGQHASAFALASHNHDSNYVNVTGDTMTGPLNLAANGLVAGTNQLVLSNGNVGIGTITPSSTLTVVGTIESTSGGVKFPDGTVQTSAAAPTWHQILPAAQRFVLVMSNEAVLDKETGLVWQKSPGTSPLNWDTAQVHCTDLTVGNRKGWRLPTIQELASLVDPTQSYPALPAGHPFSNVQINFY